MLQIIKTIILDFIIQALETGVPRKTNVVSISGKATICIGVRRSGKSTYMFQVIEKLVQGGVPRENIVYLNFFDDRLYDLHQGKLGLVLEAYYGLYPEKKGTEKVYFFFDEIQAISGWEPFIDRLQRSENCEIFITGSSAKLLSKEIGTQMRGRALSWEMFPFSFEEYLTYKKLIATNPMTTHQNLLIQKAFESYWETGGFPEVLALTPALRIKVHQEYFQSILFRDLIDRHDISHPRALIDLSHRLINNIGSFYSINKLTGYLQSLNHKAPKNTVADFVDWLEDAYFFFTVRLFDASQARSNAHPKKIYCIDHALVRSVTSGILVNSGHLLENLVFIALREKNPLVYYYRTKSGKEIDFITQDDKRHKHLIQVCENLSHSKTRQREISALEEAMGELKLPTSTVVTRQEYGTLETKNGIIHLVPIWKFLLMTP